jgi:hypothetical protein
MRYCLQINKVLAYYDIVCKGFTLYLFLRKQNRLIVYCDSVQ